MTKRARLGDADEMYHLFFDRWYDEDALRLKVFHATRPDMMEFQEFIGRTVSDVCQLSKAAATDAAARVETMRKAAESNWPRFLPVRPPIDLGWVECFDAYYDSERVESLLDKSDQPTLQMTIWSLSANSERYSVQF